MEKNPAAELAHKRAKKIGPERCSEIATIAAQARWEGHKKKPKKAKRQVVRVLDSEES